MGLAPNKDMPRRKSKYVTVTRRKHWSLAYPRHLWAELDEDERQAVVSRQQALFDQMQRESGSQTPSKLTNV